MIILLKRVNILALMAGEDELACAASSVSRLMQTYKTAVTNGNTPKHSSNSNPGSYNPESKKVLVRHWRRDAANYAGKMEEEKRHSEKESHLFSQM